MKIMELLEDQIPDEPLEEELKPAGRRFRHSAGFGKRIEFWIIGRMLKEGLDVYVPLVDDNAIDAIVRRSDGTFVEVQIKARLMDVKSGDGALFAAIHTSCETTIGLCSIQNASTRCGS